MLIAGYSLHATFLRNRIVGALRADPRTSKSLHSVSQNFVYQHPTLQSLAIAVSELLDGGVDPDTKAARSQVVEMVEKYSHNLPKLDPPPPPPTTGVVILLTGSTGNIGSFILAALIANPDIKKVYTLNRPSNAPYDRQRDAFLDKGLDTKILENSKLVQLVGDVTKVDFGLEPAVLAEVCSPVNASVHNLRTYSLA